jgi:hypothetical protein
VRPGRVPQRGLRTRPGGRFFPAEYRTSLAFAGVAVEETGRSFGSCAGSSSNTTAISLASSVTQQYTVTALADKDVTLSPGLNPRYGGGVF